MRLSDFRDEQALEVIAKLLEPVGAIAANERNAAARSGGVFGFASALLQNNPREVLAIFAILNGEEPEAYHCSAAGLLYDLIELLGDPELLALFGLRSRTAASSGGEYHGRRDAQSFVRYCAARRKQRDEETLYRVYVTTALWALTNGAKLEAKYSDLIFPPKEETRTAPEIIEHVLGGLGER